MPEDAFRRVKGYRHNMHSQCKACEARRLRRWRQEHPDAYRDQWTRQNDRSRERQTGLYDPTRKAIIAAQRRNTYLLRKYGITLDDYLALRDSQNGVCAICQLPPSGRRVGSSRPGDHPELVVDHCHTTGRVRALLCNNCNIAVAHVHEDPRIAANLLTYLTDPK
jgi:hypothetical protein